MPSNLRFTRIPTLAVLALVALTLAAVSTASAADPVARAAKTCSPPLKNGLAYLPDSSGYFTGITSLKKVSCAYAKKFVVSYWRCRTTSGRHPAGTCKRKVNGFKCTEGKRSANGVIGKDATEFDARVTCTRGGTQRIVHTYQQNLDL